jgi:hypothetical protein
MHSPDSSAAFVPGERSILLDLAQRSICHGLENASPLPVNPASYSEKLRQARASFVTLHRLGDLRGCIGHLAAIQPLVMDVSENAFAAAFRDPRFAPLERNELAGLELQISVLTPATPIEFSSEAELLESLQPGIDGLILKLGRQQGTFLPSVWESLPDSRSFLDHLKLKAGLPRDYWSDQILVFRYQTESFASPFQTTAVTPSEE